MFTFYQWFSAFLLCSFHRIFICLFLSIHKIRKIDGNFLSNLKLQEIALFKSVQIKQLVWNSHCKFKWWLENDAHIPLLWNVGSSYSKSKVRFQCLTCSISSILWWEHINIVTFHWQQRVISSESKIQLKVTEHTPLLPHTNWNYL